MGQKVSSSPRSRTVYGAPYQAGDGAGASSTNSNSGQYLSVSNGHGAFFNTNPGQSSAAGSSSGNRSRTRSLVCTPTHSHTNHGQTQGTSSDSNSDDEVLDRIIGAVTSRSGGASSNHHANGHTRASRGRSLPLSAPLPTHLFPQSFFSGIKCPVCSKFVPPDDIEVHLVVCLTKPRIVYNEDVLESDSGECVICLEDLEQGDTIARLPCLCIYHKICIDMWFERNRSCPEHPLD
ncbi:E3 ubiquitin-protein ligase znrf2 [Holothuria leucospilota]|uniref:E3 ubiquitin-protein ligase ZNRF1 n=1 Tax=Holothuria leucospilota TaxID=206669 RepID=A0A9Q1CCN0_HOLLE|nr:E3 ubiquitin-protein ligase znrf2 [Holothuria leucospilota]